MQHYIVISSRDLAHASAILVYSCTGAFREEANNLLSSYAKSLEPIALKRYKVKIAIIDSLDPFAKGLDKPSNEIIPPLEASDIVSHLVLRLASLVQSSLKLESP